ncbi:MAG: 16S rRNA (cytidine(1402)-2'-O)-methyltransferase [Gemmatimonadetes bacterium]|nr:16S rRNA (cytidine(1402)-2'-O)-methyltransferase [Gemmatimonadota bacterium]
MGRPVVSRATLYVVATPLGNLGDLSPRAGDVLRTVGLVAAEDTRRARTLLARLAARPRVLSLHAHSSPARIGTVLAALNEGESVALLTDAGTPGISDPGADLVARARAAGVPVVAVPGPSAVTAALSVSGLPADRYVFLGFLPRKGPDRAALLERAAASEWTVVVFEAANRLVHTLGDLAAACGADRHAMVARELTKLHEEAPSGTLDQLEGYYRERPPRGEVTIVIAGSRVTYEKAVDPGAARERARRLLDGGLSRRDAAQRLAGELGLSRNRAYALVAGL